MECPGRNELASFLLDELPGEQQTAIHRHVVGCPSCSGLLETMRRDGSIASQPDDPCDVTQTLRPNHADEAVADSIPGYQIVRKIHEGGQGVVYQAVQQRTKRKVAIKVMKEGPFAGHRDKARFEREVEVLGQLNHPNIVGIHDSGTASGSFYFVMDYIAGQPLDAWMTGGGRSVEETLKLFAKICEAVNAAHLRGVIHRDLKPGNIRIDPDGEPHVLDFGLAKVATASDVSVMTVTGQFLGSLPWASPEQAEGVPDKIDIRTDVYSLGVVLYQMLTGRFPYEVVGSMRDVLNRIMTAEPAKPSAIRRQIDDEVETIVLKCLCKERERRYQSAGELARDLERYLRGEPIEAKRDSTLYVLRKSLRRYRVPVAVVAGFLVLVTAAAISLASMYRQAVHDRRIAEEKTRQAETATTQAAGERDRANQKAAEASFQGYLASISAAAASARLGETPAARLRLDRCPRELRRWEWQYLSESIDRSIGALRGHGSVVGSVAFSPDGTRIVTGSWDKTARIWDAAAGSEVKTLRGHSEAVNWAAYSPDGKRILTASSDGTARLWDAATGAEAGVLRGHEGAVAAAGFSPDGRWIVTASADKTAKVWDAAAGAELSTLRGHGDKIESVAFSADGNRIVTASSDKTAKVWDTARGVELATLRGHAGVVGTAAFSPDGTRVVTGSWDEKAKVWNAVTGSEVRTLRGHSAAVSCVVFSPDGKRIVTASWDEAAKLWDAATGSEIGTLRGHADQVCCAVFSADGKRILTGSSDGTARVWEAETGIEVKTLRGHTDRIDCVAFSPDGGRMVTASWDKTARMWDAGAEAETTTLRGRGKPISCVAISPDGRRILTASSGDGPVTLWDAVTGVEVKSLGGPEEQGNCAAFSPDGRHIVADCWDNTVRVWDAATGSEVRVLRGHADRIDCVAFSPDGKRILTGSLDNTAKLWDAATGGEVLTLRGHTDRVDCVTFSPDGKRIVTGSWDRTTKVWDAVTGAETITLRALTICVGFSSDGHWLVTGSPDKAARMWDAATGAEVRKLRGHSDAVNAVAFSPDGTRIVTGSGDRTTKVWDAATGAEVLTLRGHAGSVESVAFSPDGRKIITGSKDATARIWDSTSHAQRYAQRQAALTAAKKAEPFVDTLYRRLGGWAKVAEAIREDKSMDEVFRTEALNIVLRSASVQVGSGRKIDAAFKSISSDLGEKLRSAAVKRAAEKGTAGSQKGANASQTSAPAR